MLNAMFVISKSLYFQVQQSGKSMNVFHMPKVALDANFYYSEPKEITMLPIKQLIQ